ncbi:hypothetical protein F8388_013004 [Cannabis sativa]|uniref:peroxidase n=1 Tax=Cannabis sativa TaxID=3483 RepID=A0A7J6EBZ3_CANSA|nr:hypothetical protein F8388_013004 [Cannabis sativa]
MFRRLYNFTGKGDTDPALNQDYATELMAKCPPPANPRTTVEMDPKSSLSFDSHYYVGLTEYKGAFSSDAALLTNRRAARLVRSFRDFNTFKMAFGRSMVHMGAIGVLTGCTTSPEKETDPALNQDYATELMAKCPPPANPRTTVKMDAKSSLSFDSYYYVGLTEYKGAFSSDAALLTNRRAARLVRSFRDFNTFKIAFGRSMVHMGATGVLTALSYSSTLSIELFILCECVCSGGLMASSSFNTKDLEDRWRAIQFKKK